MNKKAIHPAAAFNPVPWLMGALLFLAVFFAYRPASSGGYIWDDDDYVSQNSAVQSPTGLADIWMHPTRSPQYYPMVFTAFWVETQLGSGVRGHHEINILLHAASALMLWRILRRLDIPGAYLASVIFALHPVMVESVAWITERKNTLSLFFYLCSLWAYLRFVRIDVANEPREKPQQRDRRWYTLALLFFLFALWSKTVTASLPAAILLILWWKRGRLSLRDLLPLIPFFVVGIAASLVTTHMEHSIQHVGASGPEWDYTFAQRFLIATRAVWFYAAKLIWPAKLTFIYPKWNVDPAILWQWIFPVAMFGALVILGALHRRIGRGPLVAALFFIGTLFPALGFVNVYPMRYTFVADHYQYHASIGLIVLFAAGVTIAWRKVPWRRRASWVAPLAIGLLIVTLAVLTVRQCTIYVDAATLWADTVDKAPNSWMAWLNLGHVSAAKRPPDLQSAALAYGKALVLAPNISDPHYDMGTIYYEQKKYPLAKTEFTRAIDLEPRHANAFDMLGLCLVAEHRVDEGIAKYRAAIALNSRHNTAHFNLGVALREKGQFEEAANELITAAEIDSRYPPIWRELANCRIKQGKYDQAADALERFLQFEPNNADAHFDLYLCLMKLNRPEDAQPHFIEAITRKPELQNRLKKPAGG
jgi:tetratricopeptide (TPR) repeat protein